MARYYSEEYWVEKYKRPYEKRRAEIIDRIYSSIPFKSSWKALDLGSGTGFFADLLKKRCADIITADVDSEAACICNKKGYRAVICNCDQPALPFESGTFDFVNVLDLLEHLNQPCMLIDEVRRILKLGGYALISTQNRNSVEGFKGRLLARLTGTTWKAWDETHKKIFSYGELLSEIAKGLNIIECGGYYFGIHSFRTKPLPPFVWRVYTRFPLIHRLAFTLMVVARKDSS